MIKAHSKFLSANFQVRVFSYHWPPFCENSLVFFFPTLVWQDLWNSSFTVFNEPAISVFSQKTPVVVTEVSA